MNKVDIGYDSLLDANYELHKAQLSELKILAKSWYPNTDFTKFDERFVREQYEPEFIEMKKSGLISNYFFAYKEGDHYYLLDGFNRLFTNYGVNDFDCTVYIKIITDKLADNHLMRIMFHLNMWKLQGRGHHDLRPDNFFDRGFRLFLAKKFDINFYQVTNENYHTKTRDRSDLSVMHYYFRNESPDCETFAMPLHGFRRILENEHIIEDIKDLLSANNYVNAPFKNYEMFINGYAMFLAWRRANQDNKEYKFQTYLDLLKEDKKFFKKLPTMSGTDSTRKNIYTFFRNLPK